jgi:alkylhydroperoxidase family enzyme
MKGNMILSLEKRTTSVPAKLPKGRKKRTTTDAARNDQDLEPGLLDLVRLRVAQLHGCEWSVQEQTQRLRAEGEKASRLCALKDWRRQRSFSIREMAALNLAEALTFHPINAVPHEAVRVARVFFGKPAMICLTVVILAMNDWFYLSASLLPPNFFILGQEQNLSTSHQLSFGKLGGNSHDLPN